MNFNDIQLAHTSLKPDEVLRFELTNGTKFVIENTDRITRSTYTPTVLRVLKELPAGRQCLTINLKHVCVVCNTRKTSWLSKDNKNSYVKKGDDAL